MSESTGGKSKPKDGIVEHPVTALNGGNYLFEEMGERAPEEWEDIG